MQVRNFTIFLTALFLTLVSGPLFAAAIPNSPGWKLDKVEKAGDQGSEAQEDGVIEYSTFFALYPNDKRPPITIDGTTAQRLLNGQLTAEGVYYDRTVGAAAAAAKKSEESSSGNGVGWQVAESTYVPLSADGDAKNPNATNSSSLMKAMPAAGVTASSFAGGSNGSSGAGAGATMPAVAGQITVNNASGGGSGGGGGGAVARAPAAAASYTGDAGTAATGNLTYSQQIDAAMKQATTSACGRMGSYAQGGYCSK